jgi:signal transduction histidine kinase
VFEHAISIGAAAGGVAIIAILLGILWLRGRRLEKQRMCTSGVHKLSEDVISAASPKEIAALVSNGLPSITSATATNLYLLNRQTRSLERVPTEAEPEIMAIPLDGAQEGLANACLVCFRNRALLSIPDVRRNPLVQAGWKTGLPKSALFVPLLSKQEISGVLEIQNADKVGYFAVEEQAAIQHLANQIATALKLQDQQAMREQLFRGEKLAATGRLISGIANELREPIETIARLAESVGAYVGRPAPERDLGLLEREARRASEIVGRLVSFARQEEVSPQPIDINALLDSLVRFRVGEWRSLGLRIQNKLGPSPAHVAGVRGQLEQVFLNLIVHAEQRAAEAPPKTIAIHSSIMGGRAVVEIGFSIPQASHEQEVLSDPFREAQGLDPSTVSLDVCRGILQGHGGELRSRVLAGFARFEVDLPLVEASQPAPAPAQMGASQIRPLTLMLVEADPAVERQLLVSLSARGHRAVPVHAEEASDVVGRLRFDAVLWAVRSSGGRWSDFRERSGSSLSAFVLLSDGYDRELARSLEESGGYLLALPFEGAELDRILGEIAGRGLVPVRR